MNRRPTSGNSFTFHGRDVYSYTAARLAAWVIAFEQVGPELPTQQMVKIPYQKSVYENGKLKGTIDIHDIQYGNIWTDIDQNLVKKLNPKFGDMLHLKIFNRGVLVHESDAPYSETFGSVPRGKPLAYLNSLMQLSFALNMASFADTYKIGSGSEWSVEVTKSR